MTKYQETIEGIAEQDWHTIIANLREFSPGLWGGESETPRVAYEASGK